MKLYKNLFVLIILFVTIQICFGQEKPKAELIDEFGDTSCENLIAGQDFLLSSLQSDPTAVGYAVIYRLFRERKNKCSNPQHFIDDFVSSQLDVGN